MHPIKLENIDDHIPVIDLFIGSVSFEERSFSLISAFNKSKPKKVWFAYNTNEQEFFSSNVEVAKTFDNSELITFNSNDPLIIAKSLEENFNKSGNLENVLIDTSTFTHEGLLILFKFVFIFKPKIKNLFIGYVGAKEYSFNVSNSDEKWLSKGTKTIRSVLGYPGILTPSNKNHLIILFGFESERTAMLIESFEFDKVSIGIGPKRDSIQSDHYEINRKRHLDLLNLYPFAESFEFSLTDPFQTKEQVIRQIDKYSDYNTVITPLNNKLSTIGVALIAMERPKVQLCYIRAHEYNYKGYASPRSDCYLMKIF